MTERSDETEAPRGIGLPVSRAELEERIARARRDQARHPLPETGAGAPRGP